MHKLVNIVIWLQRVLLTRQKWLELHCNCCTGWRTYYYNRGYNNWCSRTKKLHQCLIWVTWAEWVVCINIPTFLNKLSSPLAGEVALKRRWVVVWHKKNNPTQFTGVNLSFPFWGGKKLKPPRLRGGSWVNTKRWGFYFFTHQIYLYSSLN